MPLDAEQTAIDRVAQRLSIKFPGIDPVVIARIVRRTHRHFSHHPSRDVVPILVEDAARDALQVMTHPPSASRRPQSTRSDPHR